MSQFTFVLLVLILITLIFGLLYTFKIGAEQKKGSEFDSQIRENVQEHPYSLNPVFISYFIAIFLLLAYLVYVAT